MLRDIALGFIDAIIIAVIIAGLVVAGMLVYKIIHDAPEAEPKTNLCRAEIFRAETRILALDNSTRRMVQSHSRRTDANSDKA